ncbi:ribosome hibernation-promoting factor, HPF/YfiA family [Ornithobacterium rhinotracheale]
MIENFLEYLSAERRYSKHTVESYQRDLVDFETYVQQIQKNWKNIDKKDLRNYLMQLSEAGNKPKTINRKMSAIRSFFKFLIYIDYISQNPASHIKSLKLPKEVNIPISESEIDQLLNRLFFDETWIGDRDFLLIQLLYETGIRRAELIGINISDIDFEQKQIKVLGKRNKERIIPVRDELLQHVKTLIQNSPFSKTCAALFATERGKRIYPKLVYNIVISYLRLVTNKKKVSPHVLRHSFATNMLSHGAEINAVKEILGHSSLASTQVYTHNDINQLKKVFNKAHPREKKVKIMKVNLQAVNFNAKDELVEFVEEKLGKLDQFYDQIVAADVFLKLDNNNSKENKIVEVRLQVPGDDIVVSKDGQTFEEVINLSVDTLKRLVVKKKEKMTKK